MREENRKMFAGHGQNNQNNVSNQALFGWLASRPAEHVDGLINGGGPQSQPSYFTSQQQNQLPQHLTTQFSLMRETYPKNQQQQQPPATRGLVQHVDGLANHPNSTQTLLNLLNALGPSSSLSASLGGLQGSVVFAGNQASAGMQQQFRDLARGSISAPLPCNQNESHINSSLRLSTVIDFIPQKEERTVSEGSSIVPCRARGMPKEHNAKVSTLYTSSVITFHLNLSIIHVLLNVCTTY